MYSRMNYTSFNSLNRDIAEWLQEIPVEAFYNIPRDP